MTTNAKFIVEKGIGVVQSEQSGVEVGSLSNLKLTQTYLALRVLL